MSRFFVCFTILTMVISVSGVAEAGKPCVVTGKVADADVGKGDISPSGQLNVQPGQNVVFSGLAEDGYEPAGFNIYVNDIFQEYRPSGAMRLEVTGTDPITVEALFQDVRDAVAPYVEITAPASSSITKSGVDDTVTITFETDDSNGTMSVYRDQVLLPDSAVSAGPNTWSFEDLALHEGDNVFLVKVRDDSGQYKDWDTGIDMLLVHYSSGTVDNVRAVVIIDERLYDEPNVAQQLNEYITDSEEQLGTGYDIVLDVVNGVDDYNSSQVRSHVVGLKSTHAFLEGVLFVGNIKLPSFYKPRDDMLHSQLIAHKYEDHDIVLDNIGGADADYDYMSKGTNPYPEIWTSYVPVGFEGGASENEYNDFAVQVLTFLDKAIAERNGQVSHNNKYYQLSNQLWDLGGVSKKFDVNNVDLYGVNDSGYGPLHYYDGDTVPQPDPPLTPEDYYQNAMIGSFGTYEAFARYYHRWPWMGESWQKDTILIDHFNNNTYAMAWLNAHASEYGIIITTSQAKSISNGGLILLAGGCNVAGFKQYGSTSYVDTSCSVDDNILCGFIYGGSKFLASFGCPFLRGHESEFERMSTLIGQGDYAGLAHFFRKCWQYQRSTNDYDFKMYTQELMLGDPFFVLTEGTPTPTPTPIFSDGFESGDFETGGWIPYNSDASVTSQAAYTGSYGAKLLKNTWITKTMSTVGYSNIRVKFARKTNGLDVSEFLFFTWYDGGKWCAGENTQDTSWAEREVVLLSSAANNPDFAIRFSVNGNKSNEYGYVDDVEIIGVAD